MKYEYLLIKRNGNENKLVYDKRYFNNSAKARKDFKQGDILLKCEENSIVYDGNVGWHVRNEYVVAKYEK